MLSGISIESLLRSAKMFLCVIEEDCKPLIIYKSEEVGFESNF